MIHQQHLFLIGKPGVGKTTLVKEVCSPYIDKLGGFFTEELRDIKTNQRVGFILKTFTGKTAILAKKGLSSTVKLGKYGLDVNSLNNLGIPSLLLALRNCPVIVIDELGKMEICADNFIPTVFQCLNSSAHVLATVRDNTYPFMEEIQRLAGIEILNLTRYNYTETKKRVREWIENVLY